VTAADHMATALFHAARGRGRTSPNPSVGAVVVSADGVVVGHGCTEPPGQRHAEIVALDMAGSRARGGTLYCTLEPCCHVGRTGPCVERIIAEGVVRVIASVQDPNPAVAGQGFDILRAKGIEVEVGLGAEQATAINQPFFTVTREHRPFVLMKAAVSTDGYMAEAPGRRTQLTSGDADRHAHLTRAEIDAIAVGSNTVVVDDPLLTVRGVYRPRPLIRVIFDRRLRTPPEARVLSTLEAGPVMIVTGALDAPRAERRRRLEERGAMIEVVESGTVRGALTMLANRGVGSILLEGGPTLQRAAWDEGVVDFVRLYVTPHVIGPGGLPLLQGAQLWSTSLGHRQVLPLGPDIVIEGYVHGTH
jgi:diaminohydroxyphosphoribosylaminopyrimidine deaminase / 5-amino-6-(5-phosphoribosylamino)uracil reductase